MTKIKKIVAAAVAAFSMSAIGVTAFAAVNQWQDFALSFEAYEENVYTNTTHKTNSYANDAAVTVDYGANSLRPVKFSVWDSADELYGCRKTNYTTITSNNVTQYMAYDETGYPGRYDFFYLHAYSVYNMNLEGKWTP